MGDRMAYLTKATTAIEKQCGRIEDRSSVYETAAWGMEDQNAFLNQVLRISTPLSATELLETILSIEEQLGRQRAEKYGPRLIDIDILFYNDDVIDRHGLKIPHPRMQDRRFVLVPLFELVPGKIHPTLHKRISQLLEECSDELDVNKIT